MRLLEARKLANDLQDMMAPYCERIEIAGSIRRNVLNVKDIELVCIPKWKERPKAGLFGDDTEHVNLLHEALTVHRSGFDIAIQWIKPGTSEIVPWQVLPYGKYWRGLVGVADGDKSVETVKLDLFLCRPENWGVIFCLRTGSADFSRSFVTKVRDHRWFRIQGGSLVHVETNKETACPEEQDFFDFCGVKHVVPSLRNGADDVVLL